MQAAADDAVAEVGGSPEEAAAPPIAAVVVVKHVVVLEVDVVVERLQQLRSTRTAKDPEAKQSSTAMAMRTQSYMFQTSTCRGCAAAGVAKVDTIITLNNFREARSAGMAANHAFFFSRIGSPARRSSSSISSTACATADQGRKACCARRSRPPRCGSP